jgi:hypothetical protein
MPEILKHLLAVTKSSSAHEFLEIVVVMLDLVETVGLLDLAKFGLLA